MSGNRTPDPTPMTRGLGTPARMRVISSHGDANPWQSGPLYGPTLYRMKTFIGNAFSINMLSGDSELIVTSSSPDRVPEDAVSCIGHESTAQVVSQLLGRTVPMNRVAVSLDKGDEIFVVALFTADGKPYRAPEGVILGQDDLSGLRLEIKRVRVHAPVAELPNCGHCGSVY